MTSKMKIGVWLPIYGGWLINAPIEEPEISYNYVKKVAIEAENLGYDSLWIADHMLNPRKGEQMSALEAWTTLTAVATCTRKVKLGHAVLCQAFRYPAILAKMAATLDEVSNGRFIFSIGSGWFKREFEAYGIPWNDHDELIERTEEQIKIIKALWTQDKIDFNGKYYHLVDGILEPKPLQKPCPPIWYGGNSEKSRQLITDVSDIDGWFMSAVSVDEAKQRISDIKGRLEGRALEYATYAFALVASTERDGEDMIKKLSVNNKSTIQWALKPRLVGPPSKIAESICEFEEAGINHITLMFSSTFNDMRIFSDQVLKLLH
jgi:FMNH2-dependent dimethyl sulfone monooxygenase